MNIRAATPDDAEAITRVHRVTWQSAYRGMIPQAYLDGLGAPEQITRRTDMWRSGLANPNNINVVAEDETGQVTGFVSGGACRSENGDLCATYDGELYALYLLPEYHGQGIGRSLVEAFARKLLQAGYRAILLWVLKENASSRAFYERMGGEIITEQQFTLAGTDVWETGYGWQDLSLFNSESAAS